MEAAAAQGDGNRNVLKNITKTPKLNIFEFNDSKAIIQIKKKKRR